MDQPQYNSKNERFRIIPMARIPLIAVMSGFYGFFTGGRRGFKEYGDRFLVENSHRLPTTKSGWYFYHKRKHWECVRAALRNGVRTSFKYSLTATSYFAAEAFLDYARGRVDFLNTLVTTVVFGAGFAKYYRLNERASLKLVKHGVVIGLASGLIQDLLMATRGGDVWYYKCLKLQKSTNSPLEA